MCIYSERLVIHTPDSEMACFLLKMVAKQCFGLPDEWIGKACIMGSHYQLHLEHLSWPISVLKFNDTISALQNGDDLVATLRDPDIVTNIRQLLGCRAGFRYEVQQTDSGYRIQIVKGDSDH